MVVVEPIPEPSEDKVVFEESAKNGAVSVLPVLTKTGDDTEKPLGTVEAWDVVVEDDSRVLLILDGVEHDLTGGGRVPLPESLQVAHESGKEPDEPAGAWSLIVIPPNSSRWKK